MIFSGGPRGCIGKSLALIKIKVIMIKFMQRYQNLVEPGIKDREYELLLTYHLRTKEVMITKADSK